MPLAPRRSEYSRFIPNQTTPLPTTPHQTVRKLIKRPSINRTTFRRLFVLMVVGEMAPADFILGCMSLLQTQVTAARYAAARAISRVEVHWIFLSAFYINSSSGICRDNSTCVSVCCMCLCWGKRISFSFHIAFDPVRLVAVQLGVHREKYVFDYFSSVVFASTCKLLHYRGI